MNKADWFVVAEKGREGEAPREEERESHSQVPPSQRCTLHTHPWISSLVSHLPKAPTLNSVQLP